MREIAKSAYSAHTGKTSAPASKREGHLVFGCVVVERNFFASADHPDRNNFLPSHHRVGIATVIREAPWPSVEQFFQALVSIRVDVDSPPYLN